MGIVVFLTAIGSSWFFYKRSDRSKLSISFVLMAISLAGWGMSVELCEWTLLSDSARFISLQLITFFPLFIPVLLTYVITNYANPNELKSPPAWTSLIHLISITYFLIYTLKEQLTPFVITDGIAVYVSNYRYNLFQIYLIGSIALSLIAIGRNFVKGDYVVKLHSLYMFAGILVGFITANIYSWILPILAIHVNSISVLIMVAFLWLTYIPVSYHKLFDANLFGGTSDIRNPRLGALIIELNKWLLHKLYPAEYVDICNKFEKKREELLIEAAQKFELEKFREVLHSKKMEPSKVTTNFIRRVQLIFSKPNELARKGDKED
ncbi:hypothetical protein EHO60_14860 [Leptospira fletcheri]|uniref:Histidine kinase N-terminal 7TM region domain-containing protein n=1 Tax=Leptospira fletcheri TaxID=2484981 RepID=A0A4R9G4P5_9LEPT|nr:hypothetical protein [Leptospira fletcheri]TGK06323.1 hypothetical protein EHO60_14860 [Leptospira fletcheri]